VDANGLNGGADTEDDASLLARLLFRIQNGVPNGKAGDYAQWAMQVPGVTRAWDFPLWMGLGTVGVTFVLDNQPGSIIPSPATVAQVQAYIAGFAEATAAVTVFAPVALPLNPTIHIVPNTPAVQATVIAELTDLLVRQASPGGTQLVSQVQESIGIATGVTDFALISPTVNIVAGAGQLLTLGVPAWV
jgi:uncharacterized phage protein gp47/JayE